MKKVLGVILALFLIVTASLVFSACQEDKEPEGQLPVLQVGDQWVWQYEMEGKSYTLTEEVIGEENVEGRDCYVIEMAFDPVMTSTHEGDRDKVSPSPPLQQWYLLSGKHTRACAAAQQANSARSP